ncbi:MAG: ABC transporter substrate-binding protein, partial [Chlamydiales bacterium]
MNSRLHTIFPGLPKTEGYVLSFIVPSGHFYKESMIHLLHARRQISRYLEELLGFFRDCNGGLLEKQQVSFETLKTQLPVRLESYLFLAEKLFYAIQPIEARISISSDIFNALLDAILTTNSYQFQTSINHIHITVIKSKDPKIFSPSPPKAEKFSFHALVSYLGWWYFVILSSVVSLQMSCQKKENLNVLNLNFQEGDLPSIHPHHLEDHSRGCVLALLLYEGLTSTNEEGKVELRGAREVHISDDQTLYTFTLHSRVWSDGTPLTAYHYEKAWKQAIAPDSDCLRADLFYIIKNGMEAKKAELPLDHFGVHAIDDHTLQVELSFPVPYFLRLLAEPIFLPVLKDEKDPKYFNGPFLIKEWVRDERLCLERNPYFWDHKQISLANINISFVTDPNTVLHIYEKNAIDFIGEPLCRLSNEAMINLQKKGVLKTQYPTRFFWVFFNTEKAPFHNSKIRQALSTAISRQLITNHILAGDTPLYTLFRVLAV